MTDLFLERDARLSACGTYRYLLRRTWDHSKPRVTKAGAPKHPLYIKTGTPLEVFGG